MTQILTIRQREAGAFDARVNVALQENERWTKTHKIQTHYHDGWFVAVIMWSAPDRPTRRAEDA
jgi:hypothetical protein